MVIVRAGTGIGSSRSGGTIRSGGLGGRNYVDPFTSPEKSARASRGRGGGSTPARIESGGMTEASDAELESIRLRGEAAKRAETERLKTEAEAKEKLTLQQRNESIARAQKTNIFLQAGKDFEGYSSDLLSRRTIDTQRSEFFKGQQIEADYLSGEISARRDVSGYKARYFDLGSPSADTLEFTPRNFTFSDTRNRKQLARDIGLSAAAGAVGGVAASQKLLGSIFVRSKPVDPISSVKTQFSNIKLGYEQTKQERGLSSKGAAITYFAEDIGPSILGNYATAEIGGRGLRLAGKGASKIASSFTAEVPKIEFQNVRGTTRISKVDPITGTATAETNLVGFGGNRAAVGKAVTDFKIDSPTLAGETRVSGFSYKAEPSINPIRMNKDNPLGIDVNLGNKQFFQSIGVSRAKPISNAENAFNGLEFSKTGFYKGNKLSSKRSDFGAFGSREFEGIIDVKGAYIEVPKKVPSVAKGRYVEGKILNLDYQSTKSMDSSFSFIKPSGRKSGLALNLKVPDVIVKQQVQKFAGGLAGPSTKARPILSADPLGSIPKMVGGQGLVGSKFSFSNGSGSRQRSMQSTLPKSSYFNLPTVNLGLGAGTKQGRASSSASRLISTSGSSSAQSPISIPRFSTPTRSASRQTSSLSSGFSFPNPFGRAGFSGRGTGFGFLPKINLPSGGSGSSVGRPAKGSRKFKRTISPAAAILGLTARKASRAEYSGLVERPILVSGRRRR